MQERSILAVAGVASLVAAARMPLLLKLAFGLTGIGLLVRAAASHGARQTELAQKSRAVDVSVEESFPASDPPASRLPDEPPVNAEAKWQAAAAAAHAGR